MKSKEPILNERQNIRVSKSFSSECLDFFSNNLGRIKLGFDESDSFTKALIVRSKDFVTKASLEKYPNIRAVVSATSGFDHFDLKLLKTHPKIDFCYSPEANVQSCAELCMMHILNLLKKQKKHSNVTRSFDFIGSEVSKKNIFIIGFGRIAKKFSKLLKAFEADVYAYDPYIKDDVFRKNGVIKVSSLKEGLSFADIISLNCPLTQKTLNLVDTDFLEQMKISAFLLNCARGALIKEGDLIKALKSNSIAGAALDVFEVEPLNSKSELLKFSNVYLSPHIGGFTKEAQLRSAIEAFEQVKLCLKPQTSKNQNLSHLPINSEWLKDSL